MSFNEYKNAEYWTGKMIESEEEKEASAMIERNERQMSIFALIGWLFIGAGFIAALWFACFLDSTMFIQ